jgi:hypothetical protein
MLSAVMLNVVMLSVEAPNTSLPEWSSLHFQDVLPTLSTNIRLA